MSKLREMRSRRSMQRGGVHGAINGLLYKVSASKVQERGDLDVAITNFS